MSKPMSMGWPRLTEQLPPGEWDPGEDYRHCQRCYRYGEFGEDLYAWQEHDDRDRREPRAVVLCVDCSDDLIEPHPRLYRRLKAWAPMPGVMDLCQGCVHRDGYLCRHPDLTINGGTGLEVTHPAPYQAMVTRPGPKGRRCSRERIWQGPPTGCAGRREAS